MLDEISVLGALAGGEAHAGSSLFPITVPAAKAVPDPQ